MNWKIMALIYLLTIGVYAFIIKIIMNHLPVKSVLLLAWPTAFILIYLLNFDIKLLTNFNKWHLITILSGLLLGVGIITQYRLYASENLSKILPIISQAGLISIILAVIFLHEKITIKLVSGIILGIFSILLLMG